MTILDQQHPESERQPSVRAGRRIERRSAPALIVLGVSAFGAAFVVGWWLFPLGSINHDEPMYRFGAELLRTGHLTLPREAAPFAPWNGAVRDGHFVLAYAPVWPAALATSDLVGSMRLAVAATSAAAVLLMATVGRELFGRWTEGVVAAAILLGSPLFLIQTGTYLGYLFQLVLDLTLVLLVLRSLPTGVGRRRHVTSRTDADQSARADGILAAEGRPTASAGMRAVAIGAVWGLAAYARPYDALLVAVPLGVLMLVRARRVPGLLRAWTLRIGAGAAAPLAMLGAGNWATMGSPLRSTFSVTGSKNVLLFGERGIFESDTFDFTPGNGVTSVLQTARVGPGWIFGGVVLLALAALGFWRHRARPAAWAVGGVGAVFVLGYGLWWSSYAIGYFWPGQKTMGTFYHLPVLIPLALFGAAGLTLVFDRRRAFGWAAVAAMVGLTAITLPSKIEANRKVSREYRATQRLIEEADVGRAVLFMEDRGPAGSSSAAPFLENEPRLDDPVLYAVDGGPRNIRVMARMPDRSAFRLRVEAKPEDDLFSPTRFVERLEIRRGRQVTLRFRIVNPLDASMVQVRLVTDDGTRTIDLDRDSEAGASYEASWDLTTSSDPDADADADTDLGSAGAIPVQRDGTLAVRVRFAGNGSSAEWYERRYPYVVTDGEVQVLTPGWGRYLFQYGDPVWVNRDVDAVLDEVG